MYNDQWTLSAGPVCFTPLEIERQAYRDISRTEKRDVYVTQNVYITAPHSFDWNQTDKWMVATTLEKDDEVIEGCRHEWQFDTEGEAVEFIRQEFMVDMSMDQYRKSNIA